MFIQGVGFITSNVIIPLITISVAFNIISAILPEANLISFSKTINKFALGVNGVLLAAFLAIAGLNTTVATSVDEVTIKTTEAAVSNIIPVVGKFVSDSVELVFGAAEVIGKIAGIVTLIVLVIIVFKPIIKIGVIIFSLCIIIAISEAIGTDSKISKMLSSFNDVYKTLLGMVITTSVIFIVAIGISISLLGKISS